jgi:hypothetical protein
MTVEETTTVDAIGVDSESGDVRLLLSDHLDWESEQEHLTLLQAKLNAYLRFIESGELVEKYPAAAGRPPRIDLVLRVPPTDGALVFLQNAEQTIEAVKIGFGWRVLRTESDADGSSQVNVGG